MKTLPPILSLCFLFLLLTGERKEDSRRVTGKTVDKYAPTDHLDLVRGYPDATPDYRGYEQAMRQAHADALQAARVQGFNEPWTMEGPGNLGARINVIAVPGNRHDTIYIGYARGGLYRTYDGGANWTPLFDDKEKLCISSIAINPLNDRVIYAGTGDRNITGIFAIGDGIYKSSDGGDHWTLMGLTDQRTISEIAINPVDTNIVYAACMGLPSAPNSDRGLYKSADGGSTWTQVLYVGDSAGINDIAIHPGNPDIIYATGWNRLRTSVTSFTTGDASRIWKSTDGGSTWAELGNGLPAPPLGRVGIAIFPPHPDTLYALYIGLDSQLEGIYRTFDGGDSWTEVPTETSNLPFGIMGGFGWYFSGIYVNPLNYEDIFIEAVGLWRTLDGGSSWFSTSSGTHADKHHMLFLDASTFLLATDGGLFKTTDNAASWTKIESNKTCEMYRVAHNSHFPDMYYGGMQDNGTSGGNASAANWPRIYGGDGFQMQFHPTDPNLFYVEVQNGGVRYTSNGGNSFNSISEPWWNERTNWDMPYMLSSHDPQVLYAGSYRVWKDELSPTGEWSPISGDLTDGIILASARHTISTIDESPLDEDHLYVGTSDANVWRTLDGGDTWDPIYAGLPDRYVTSVKASPTDADHLFVTHSGYKHNEYIPHIHKSEDNGDSWIDISGDLPSIGVNDIVVYPQHEDSILFAATDGGVYGTINGGVEWHRLGSNMPMIAVVDMELDLDNNKLIAGTVGKSIMTYPLDNLVQLPVPSPLLLTLLTSPVTCIGSNDGSIDLTVTGGIPPYSFSWNNGAVTEDISGLAAGTYTVAVVDNEGQSASLSATIGSNPVNPPPVVGPVTGPTSVQAWTSFNYSVPATNGSSFYWSALGGEVTSSASNAATVLWQAGPEAILYVTETDANGCSSTASVTVTIHFVGIEETHENTVVVYPNPATDVLNISLPKTFAGPRMTLRDLHGKTVMARTLTRTTESIDIGRLPAGHYTISFEKEGTRLEHKVVVF